MKYFILVFILSCVGKPIDRVSSPCSIFLFMPRSNSDLSRYNYKEIAMGQLYSKTVADTLENIEVINLDSGQFRKNFYVRTSEPTNVVSFINNNADSVLVRLDQASLIKYEGHLFFIKHGFSYGRKVLYLITYLNMKIYGDKVKAINYLKEWAPHVDSLKAKSIYSSLDYIDKGWRNYPTEIKDTITVTAKEF